MCHHPRPIRRFTTLLLLLSCSTCNQVEKLVVVSCWWWYRRGQVHYIYPLLAAPTDAWLIFIRFRSNNLWTCYSKMRLFILLKKKEQRIIHLELNYTENFNLWRIVEYEWRSLSVIHSRFLQDDSSLSLFPGSGSITKQVWAQASSATFSRFSPSNRYMHNGETANASIMKQWNS